MKKPVRVEINEGQSSGTESHMFNRGDAAIEHLRKMIGYAESYVEFLRNDNLPVTADFVNRQITAAKYFLRFGENQNEVDSVQKPTP